MLTRAGCQVPFLLTIVLDTSCQAQVKAASCYADRLTPDPNLSRASACPGRGWQAVSQATVSHSTVFPPGDFPFLLGLPRSVTGKAEKAHGTKSLKTHQDCTEAPIQTLPLLFNKCDRLVVIFFQRHRFQGHILTAPLFCPLLFPAIPF